MAPDFRALLMPVALDRCATLARTVIEWHGLMLVSAPALEAIEAGETIPIIDRWSERGQLFVRLPHPHRPYGVEFCVRGAARLSGRAFALLELGDWHGGKRSTCTSSRSPEKMQSRWALRKKFLMSVRSPQPPSRVR